MNRDVCEHFSPVDLPCDKCRSTNVQKSTLREAAQQALEACEQRLPLKGQAAIIDELNNLRAALVEDAMQKFTDVNQELEAALADGDKLSPGEPVQEPVAWRWGYRSVTTGEMDWRGYVEIPAHPNLRSPEIIMEALYTAPPQRKPLSDTELARIWDDALDQLDPRNQLRFVARAIERAHGIGGQP